MSDSEKKSLDRSRAWSRREFLAASLLGSALGGSLFPGCQESAGAASDAGRLRAVPFFSERSDLDNGVACARMVLSYFEPDEHFPYEDVIEMIGRRGHCWVFEAQLMPILIKKGYRVILHATTPYQDLAAGRGLSRYGPEAQDRIDVKALAWAARYLSNQNYVAEEPTLARGLQWFEQGELVMISADRAALRSDPELPYCRYNLILTGSEGNSLVYHDPAQGPHRRSPLDLIRKAFEAPGPDRAVLRVRSR